MLGVTAKLAALLARPPTVTTTGPVVAPVGTGATILVALQFDVVATVPLNVTALVPWLAPKFAPAIVTDAPSGPDEGFRLVMLGGSGLCTTSVAVEVWVKAGRVLVPVTVKT